MRLNKHIKIRVPCAKIATIFHKTKKGKGSYTRKQKHKRNEAQH